MKIEEIKNYFEYDGQVSRDFGLKILNTFKFETADEDLSFVSVPALNGDLIQSNKRFNNVIRSFECHFVPSLTYSTVQELSRGMAAWLRDIGGYKRLYFTGDNQYYYEAKAYQGLSIARVNDNFSNEITVEFSCKPFKKRRDGEDKINLLDKQEVGFYNPEKWESEPIFYLQAKGDATITVNGIDYIIRDVDGDFVVDNEKHEIYNSTGLLNSHAEFPNQKWIAIPNDTATYIKLSSNVTKATFKPNWRTLA